MGLQWLEMFLDCHCISKYRNLLADQFVEYERTSAKLLFDIVDALHRRFYTHQ